MGSTVAASRPGADPPPEDPRERHRTALYVAAGLIGFLALQYAATLALPFTNDDYLIFGKLHSVSFITLWIPQDLLSGFWRPWSRELHFWLLSHLFGPNPPAFHLASFILWFTAMGLFFSLFRRLVGTATAALATLLAATQAAWGVLLVWAAGAQDLWMICAGLAFLLALMNRRTTAAALALGIALFSKETAVTLPAIGVGYLLIVERESFRNAARRTWLFWTILAAWALIHPMLGGRLFHEAPATSAQPAIARIAPILATLLELMNLDRIPRPEAGWWEALRSGIMPASLVAVAAALGLRGARPTPPGGRSAEVTAPSASRVAVWAATWAVLGWLPFLLPGPGWHAYYCLWGAFGAWMIIATLLGGRTQLAIVMVLALALLRPARTGTPQFDLGSEWYHRRAAALTNTIRRGLQSERPSLPPHSRIYLDQMPGGVGLVASPGYSPALQTWYRDNSLQGYFYSQYSPRAEGDSLGGDYFFRFDSLGRPTEIIKGPEDLSRARTQGWRQLHGELATLMFLKRDPLGAVGELEKMVAVFPDDPYLLYSLGVCYEFVGKQSEADDVYQRAARLPGAGEAMHQQARADWLGRL
jgi:hypothetical protein